MKKIYFSRMSWMDADFENVKNYEDGEVFLTREEADADFDEMVKEAKDSVSFGEGIEVVMLEAEVEDEDFEEGNFEDAIANADFTDKNEMVSYEYASVEGALLVCWHWNRYIGYARELREVRYGYYGETEEMCIGVEKTFHPQWSVLCTAAELKGLNDAERRELAVERLNESHWKWNMSSSCARCLDECFPEEEDEEEDD